HYPHSCQETNAAPTTQPTSPANGYQHADPRNKTAQGKKHLPDEADTPTRPPLLNPQHNPRKLNTSPWNSPHTPPKTTTHAPESATRAPESAAPAPEPATRGPGNATRAWVHPIVDLDNPVCQLDADADRTETGVVLADQRKEARMGQGSVLRGRFGRTRRRAGDGERRCVEGKVVTITGGARGIGART